MTQAQERSLLALDEAARELRTLDADLSARIEALRSRGTSGIVGAPSASITSSASCASNASASAQQLGELQRFARERIARVESRLSPRALFEKPAVF